MRRESKKVKIGNIRIGGENPVAIQSMTKTETKDVSATIEQILELSDCGCEIVRLGLPDITSARQIGKIKEKSPLPIIADIHFNYKIALCAIEQGADKIRLNPGNIRNKEKIKAIVKKAKEAGIPIRVGANSGSLPRGETLVSAAMHEIKILEEQGFYDIVVSLKGADIHQTIFAYREMARLVKYPFHIGITEAGPLFSGSIISSIGCGILLFEGLGDTIRVSLTSSPMDEVKVAKEIIQALNIRSFGPRIVSCPGCGRTGQEFFKIAYRLGDAISKIKGLEGRKIAIMGCEVNGPGEAEKAYFGIVCGRNFAIYKNGKIIEKTSNYNRLIEIMEEKWM